MFQIYSNRNGDRKLLVICFALLYYFTLEEFTIQSCCKSIRIVPTSLPTNIYSYIHRFAALIYNDKQRFIFTFTKPKATSYQSKYSFLSRKHHRPLRKPQECWKFGQKQEKCGNRYFRSIYGHERSFIFYFPFNLW